MRAFRCHALVAKLATPAHIYLMRPPFDHVPDGRRRNMSAIRGKDTKPELAIRRGLHALGYRFVLHRRDLPGRPDISFPARQAVLEVRGCFFHRHGCANSVLPKERAEWWQAKLEGNVTRDQRNEKALAAMGWRLIVVWECDVRRDFEGVCRSLATDLGPPRFHVDAATTGRRKV